MHRLAKSGLALALTVILLALSSRWIGSRQDRPDWLTWLGISRCQADLCVMGIQPGATAWEAAGRRLMPLLDASTDSAGDIIFDRADTKTMFWKDLFEDKTNISVMLKQNGLFRFDALIEYFGDPCSLDITESDVYVEYPQFIAVISPPTRYPITRLDPDLPVSTILLYGQRPAACVEPLLVSSGQNYTTRWCGFASVRHYVQQCRK